MVDAFTFEVARAVDRDLSAKIDRRLSFNTDRQRLAAVLLALKDAGLLADHKQGRETWFSGSKDLFNEPDVSTDVWQNGFATLAKEYVISFELRKTEMRHSIELSKQYRADLDVGLVERSWREIGAKVGSILEGHLHLLGPEALDGLIFHDLTRSTAEGYCCVWFSLGDRNDEPVMVDLRSPSLLGDESPIQYPLPGGVRASEQGRLFATLLDFQIAASESMMYIFDWPLEIER